MTHGFAVSLGSSDDTTARLDIEAASNSDGQAILRPSPNIAVWISAPDNPDFAQARTVGNWSIVSIGECFGNVTPVSSIEDSLAGSSETTADEIIALFRALPGQYCAVCYNNESGDLLTITDPSGIRSLFSIEIEETQIIASSLSALRKLAPHQAISPNIENQPFLFRYAYSPPGETVFAQVSELLPGNIIHSNIYDDSADESHSFLLGDDFSERRDSSHFSFHKEPSQFESELYARLISATERQLGNARRVGVLLGGFDSALVASLLHRLGAHVETYSFQYSDDSYNQPFADLLSQTLDIPHHWVKIDPEIIRVGLDRYGESCNWPTIWPNYVIQTQHLCTKMSDDGMESCFSGDGCDTVFLGYPSTHRRGQVYKKLPHIPETLESVIRQLFHLLRLEYVFGHVGRVFLSLLDASTVERNDRPLHSFQIFDDKSYRRLTGMKSMVNNARKKHFDALSEQTRGQDFERKLYLAKSLISPNRCKLVSSSDMSGLAIHSPYMHPIVKSFGQSLPEEELRPSDKSHIKEGKQLLMTMAERFDLLPHEIIYQPKLAAIKSPIDSWLYGNLKDFSLEKLSRLPFEYNERYVRSLLSEQYVEKLYKDKFADDDVVSLAISLLITYACFFD
jgi:asparagine synthase (glutamine-hydrolysing)